MCKEPDLLSFFTSHEVDACFTCLHVEWHASCGGFGFFFDFSLQVFVLVPVDFDEAFVCLHNLFEFIVVFGFVGHAFLHGFGFLEHFVLHLFEKLRNSGGEGVKGDLFFVSVVAKGDGNDTLFEFFLT